MLDADVVIRGEKGSFDLKNWVTSRGNDQFEIAAITVAELWHGVERVAGSQKTKMARSNSRSQARTCLPQWLSQQRNL